MERKPSKTLTLKSGRMFYIGADRVRLLVTDRGMIRVSVWSRRHVRLAKSSETPDNSTSSFVGRD